MSAARERQEERGPGFFQAINAQNRIAPAPNEPKAIGGGNARQIGPATTGSIDNMGVA